MSLSAWVCFLVLILLLPITYWAAYLQVSSTSLPASFPLIDLVDYTGIISPTFCSPEECRVIQLWLSDTFIVWQYIVQCYKTCNRNLMSKQVTTWIGNASSFRCMPYQLLSCVAVSTSCYQGWTISHINLISQKSNCLCLAQGVIKSRYPCYCRICILSTYQHVLHISEQQQNQLPPCQLSKSSPFSWGHQHIASQFKHIHVHHTETYN